MTTSLIQNLLSLIFCLIFLSFSLSPLQAQDQKKQPPKRPPSPVAVHPVQLEPHRLQVKLNGTLRPIKRAFLSVDDSGRIQSILKRDGDFAQAGELLAQAVNPSQQGNLAIAKISLKQTEIQRDLAKKKLERTQFLIKRKVSSEEQLDADRANFQVQQNNIEHKIAEIARLNSLVESYSIKAPFDGQILTSSLEVGQWVSPAQILYLMVNYETLELKLGVPGRYLGKLVLGSKVEIQLKDSGKMLEGTIKAITHSVEETTGNFLAVVHIPNPEGLALSGLLVQASIPIGRPEEKMFVPRDAIVRRGERTHIVVVREGMAHIEPVQVDGNQGDLVVVRAKTLQPGEQVVVRGNERLFPGTPVTINKDIKLN